MLAGILAVFARVPLSLAKGGSLATTAVQGLVPMATFSC
jgi:hypothetical protein